MVEGWLLRLRGLVYENRLGISFDLKYVSSINDLISEQSLGLM